MFYKNAEPILHKIIDTIRNGDLESSNMSILEKEFIDIFQKKLIYGNLYSTINSEYFDFLITHNLAHKDYSYQQFLQNLNEYPVIKKSLTFYLEETSKDYLSFQKTFFASHLGAPNVNYNFLNILLSPNTILKLVDDVFTIQKSQNIHAFTSTPKGFLCLKILADYLVTFQHNEHYSVSTEDKLVHQFYKYVNKVLNVIDSDILYDNTLQSKIKQVLGKRPHVELARSVKHAQLLFDHFDKSFNYLSNNMSQDINNPKLTSDPKNIKTKCNITKDEHSINLADNLNNELRKLLEQRYRLTLPHYKAKLTFEDLETIVLPDTSDHHIRITISFNTNGACVYNENITKFFKVILSKLTLEIHALNLYDYSFINNNDDSKITKPNYLFFHLIQSETTKYLHNNVIRDTFHDYLKNAFELNLAFINENMPFNDNHNTFSSILHEKLLFAQLKQSAISQAKTTETNDSENQKKTSSTFQRKKI